MQQLLSHISEQAAALKRLQPVSAEDTAKLNKKFRLEWNYNSNHIEGNTLTYGETELFLIFGETKGNHEYREYEEMQGHDVALKMVEELAEDKERTLNEQFIRQLNQVILKKPFYKEAITPDGQATRRLIKVGEYKSLPNSVLLQNGEIFNYDSPAETPAKMNDLLQWYRDAAENKEYQPVEVAAELHYRFVLIHPFDDGNGRISRLLMNYHLLKNCHPPVIIKSADKKNYLRALHEADTGKLSAFIEYIEKQLLWSYDISIKAAKGENIDEPGDWEKEIDLLKKNVPPASIIHKEKSREAIDLTWQNSLLPFFESLRNHLIKIDALFDGSIMLLFENNGQLAALQTNDNFQLLLHIFANNDIAKARKLPDSIKVQFYWKGYKYAGTNTFNTQFIIDCHFSSLQYTISFSTSEIKNKEVLYSHYLSEREIELLVYEIKSHILEQIKKLAKR